MSLPYDYQYDITAIAITVALILIFMFRKVPLEKSGKLFLHLLLVNLVTAILDIISIFAINDYTCMPLWLDYVSSLGYLYCYNCLNILCFEYIDSKCKIPRVQKSSKYIAYFLYFAYATIIFSSPFTHYVAYFTEDGVYDHGPVMKYLYILPFIFFASEIVMMYHSRRNFNTYQVITTIVFIVIMITGLVVTIIFPRALVGSACMAIVLVIVYLAYENPAYYSYKDTACLNAYAFDKFLRQQEKHGKISTKRFMLIVLTDRDAMKAKDGVTRVNWLDLHYAMELQKVYKRRVFQYIEGCYVLVSSKKDSVPQREDILKILRTVNEQVSIDTMMIEDIWPHETCNDVEKLIDYRITNMRPEFKNMPSEEFLRKIEAREGEKQKILTAIRRGIAEKSFKVYYQPIYDIRNGRFRSAEALIRLIDEEFGFINPETLITIAEEYGYIDDITEIVLNKVCEFLGSSGIRNHGIDYIEVNLSPICCKQRDILKKIILAMKKNAIPYEAINFEITETADMQKDETIDRTLNVIHDMGFELSIDDYGSGFASADYLIKMPISIVKIDKEILWAAMKDHWAMHILESNIRMIKALEKGVVIEGVENEEMLNVLTNIEPDLFIQGYYYSKPVPEQEFAQFIKEHFNK